MSYTWRQCPHIVSQYLSALTLSGWFSLLRFNNYYYLTMLHIRLIYRFRFHWRYIILCKIFRKLVWWSLLYSPLISFVLFIYLCLIDTVNLIYLQDNTHCFIKVSIFKRLTLGLLAMCPGFANQCVASSNKLTLNLSVGTTCPGPMVGQMLSYSFINYMVFNIIAVAMEWITFVVMSNKM